MNGDIWMIYWFERFPICDIQYIDWQVVLNWNAPSPECAGLWTERMRRVGTAERLETDWILGTRPRDLTGLSLSLCPRINRPVHRKPPTRKSYSQKHTARVIFLPNTVHYQLRSCQVQSIIQKIETQYIVHWICVFQQTQWLRVGAGLMVAR